MKELPDGNYDMVLIDQQIEYLEGRTQIWTIYKIVGPEEFAGQLVRELRVEAAPRADHHERDLHRPN